jgi:hypothetical protein
MIVWKRRRNGSESGNKQTTRAAFSRRSQIPSLLFWKRLETNTSLHFCAWYCLNKILIEAEYNPCRDREGRKECQRAVKCGAEQCTTSNITPLSFFEIWQQKDQPTWSLGYQTHSGISKDAFLYICEDNIGKRDSNCDDTRCKWTQIRPSSCQDHFRPPARLQTPNFRHSPLANSVLD